MVKRSAHVAGVTPVWHVKDPVYVTENNVVYSANTLIIDGQLAIVTCHHVDMPTRGSDGFPP